MRKAIFLSAVLALLAAGAVYLAPRAEHAMALRLAADEPERLADLRLVKALDTTAVAREIESALAEGDIELAASFFALAETRGIAVPADLAERLAAAQSTKEKIRRSAMRFGRGLATGNAEGIEGFAGAATGDLLVYGDLRDLAREGARWVRGEAADPLIAGLAAVGIVVTAGTYFTSGSAAPARAGVSLFKATRRAGKVGVSLAADVGRVVRTGGGGKALSAFADLGKIESKAGARVAMEGMRHADDVADLARVSRLAEKNGRTTLAILKTLGRGALVLGAGAVTGALWVLGAAVNIFLLVITVCTLFANLVRGLWRTGRFAWRYGSYTVTRVAAAT
jgi:hypothetical protein